MRRLGKVPVQSGVSWLEGWRKSIYHNAKRLKLKLYECSNEVENPLEKSKQRPSIHILCPSPHHSNRGHSPYFHSSLFSKAFTDILFMPVACLLFSIHLSSQHLQAL